MAKDSTDCEDKEQMTQKGQPAAGDLNCRPEVTGSEAQRIRGLSTASKISHQTSQPEIFNLYEDNDAPSENGDDDDIQSLRSFQSSCSAKDAVLAPRSMLSQVLWLLVVVVIALSSAWAGVHFGANQSQLESLEAKMRSLEQQLMKASTESLRPQAAESPPIASAGVASVSSGSTCSRGDACSAESSVSSQDEGNRGSNGEPKRKDVFDESTQGGTRSERKAAEDDSHAPDSGNSKKDDSEYPDLACEASPRWLDVKALVWAVFGRWQVGVALVSQSDIDQVLDRSAAVLGDLLEKPDTCGMGRLCMTLLTMAQSKQLQLHSLPSIHSPILTILLDVPWRLLMRSGWPIFGLLAQLSLRSPQGADVPVDGGLETDYYSALHAGLVKEIPDVLAGLGAQYIQSSEAGDGNQTSMHVMPALCGLATQLLEPANHENVDEPLKHMQHFFRQQVTSITDLQGTLDSAWPLHSVLHAAAVNLMNREKQRALASRDA